ncbi:hypothetical protein L596_017579 [Steinernema carpocapsae]|uniref:Uncharacterized protein n=1 Tax=Steinernema carpocapsae TaxID=34508 RepID=A0A4U5N2I0_STECR|nr:hypothetical protein L596_017579 [Steinernema carpocapsae]
MSIDSEIGFECEVREANLNGVSSGLDELERRRNNKRNENEPYNDDLKEEYLLEKDSKDFEKVFDLMMRRVFVNGQLFFCDIR